MPIDRISLLNSGDDVALQRLCTRLGMDPQYLRRLRNAFFKKQLAPAAALEELPPELRAYLTKALSFRVLQLQDRHESTHDGAAKLVFRTPRGHLVESVILRIASGR